MWDTFLKRTGRKYSVNEMQAGHAPQALGARTCPCTINKMVRLYIRLVIS
jgi:hypothetical protein